MPITITPTVATVTIGMLSWTHADWEADTPATISGIANAIAGQIVALGATTGTLVKAISGNTTLSGPEAANITFIFTGALLADADITFPAGTRAATIVNNTTGGFALNVGLAAGAAVTVPAAGSAHVYCDGTDFGLSGVPFEGTGAAVPGNLNVGGFFFAAGNSAFAANLDIGGTLEVAGNSLYSANLAIGGTLDVAGNSSHQANLDIGGTLDVAGFTTLLSTLDVSADITGGGDLDVVGTATAAFVRASRAAAECRIYIDAPVGQSSWLDFQSGALDRWLMGKNSAAESGSDVGSDFQIAAFDDAGSSLGVALKIWRANRVINLPAVPTSSAGLNTGDVWSNSGVLTLA